jgi:alkanesulfonate monooxygenase SsuD/methylene tetrahydromethanopterin reductase-like flavin-dependent oxidoreductase (luciferase family)
MLLSVVILPVQRWPEAQSIWRRAEEWGLYAGYTYDHLSWRIPFRDGPWFSMIPTLTAAASVTTTLRLGPLVTSANFRHPLVLAKDLIALDDVSLGRVIVGVGAGGTGFDARTLGHPEWSARERHERFVEFTRALEQLLREPSSTLTGAYYPVVDSRQLPGPYHTPRPPILVSALGRKSLALAAEVGDGWVSVGRTDREENETTWSAVSAQVATLDAQLDSRERSRLSLHRVLLHFMGDETPTASFEAFVDWAGRYRSLGFDEVVLTWPVPGTPFDVDETVFERICREGHDVLSSWE